ncbi:unnamed protein product [Laminaria digitata]
MHGGLRVLEEKSDLQARYLLCCVIGGETSAQKVACCLCSLVSISPRDYFLSLFPAPFPAPFLSLFLYTCISCTHTSPPDITVLWKHAKCDHPCPFLARLDALGTVVIDPLLIGGYLVLLARGTRRTCVGGKHSRFWRSKPHATARTLHDVCPFFIRLGWRAWIFRGSIWCRSAVVALFRAEHLVW